ncbi:MAG: hypothetical protein K0R73_208 [Candidatus Midichloriaceae bacterium]|jgi:hypothetical protein|nr:hypothetical protein [Candidatus Midichloriaceae bacterium]
MSSKNNLQQIEDIGLEYLRLSMKELINILKQEIEFVRSNNTSAIINLQKKKLDLINFLESQKIRIYKDNQLLQHLPEAESLEIRALAEELEQVTNENQLILKKELLFKQDLMKTISDLILEKGAVANNYTNTGKIDRKALKQTPPSLSINDKV